MPIELWQGLGIGGIITLPLSLMVYAMRMMLRGDLVSRKVMQDRIDDLGKRLEDRDKIIEAKDERADEQAKYIDVLQDQLRLATLGNKTTLQVVEALPKVAGTTSMNRSETS